MKKTILLLTSLIIIGAGCKTSLYSPLNETQLTSADDVTDTISYKAEDTGLQLTIDAREKINMIEYEIISYQLFDSQNILFFSLDLQPFNSTVGMSDKSGSALYMYDLNTKEVTKILSSKEVPESLLFDVDDLSTTFTGSLPYLYVERGTLSPNNRYLQLRTYDIVGGEWFFYHTILVDLQTKKVKNIGRTENFEWLGENKFRYKSSIPYNKNCDVWVGPNVCFRASPWENKMF